MPKPEKCTKQGAHLLIYYRIFRTISRDFFLQKFQGSGLYSGEAYVWTFPKNHAVHTARYGVPRSALDHDQLTHSIPQSLTVSAAVWPPLPCPPWHSLSLSLCVCVCLVSHSMAVNCTAVSSGCLLHAPAECGKTPSWRPVLGTQLWPPAGISDIAISEA